MQEALEEVQELMSIMKLDTCKDLSIQFILLIGERKIIGKYLEK